MRAKRDRDRRLFTVWKMKWVYLVGLMVIIGGVMAFGFLGFFVFHFDRTSALSMIAIQGSGWTKRPYPVFLKSIISMILSA